MLLTTMYSIVYFLCSYLIHPSYLALRVSCPMTVSPLRFKRDRGRTSRTFSSLTPNNSCSSTIGSIYRSEGLYTIHSLQYTDREASIILWPLNVRRLALALARLAGARSTAATAGRAAALVLEGFWSHRWPLRGSPSSGLYDQTTRGRYSLSW